MPMPGPLELVIILVIALLILGPGKLPDVGSALGKSIKEFRKAATDVQDAARVDPAPRPAGQVPSRTGGESAPTPATNPATSAASAAPAPEPSTEPKP